MSYTLNGFLGNFNSVTNNSYAWNNWVDNLKSNDQESLAGFAESLREYKGWGRTATMSDVTGRLLNYSGEGDYNRPVTITGNDLIDRYLLTSSYESNKKNNGYSLSYDTYYQGLKSGAQDLFGYELSTLHQISFDAMFNRYMAEKADKSSFTTYQAYGYAKNNDVKLSDTKANSLINTLNISGNDQLGSNYTSAPPADSDGDGYTDDVDAYPANKNYWDAASKKAYDDKLKKEAEEAEKKRKEEEQAKKDAYEASLTSIELFALARIAPSKAEATRLSALGAKRAQEETDAKNAIDTDNDGRPDWKDDFPNDSSEQDDSDSDGVGDNADFAPNDKLNWSDNDGDGKADQTKDAYPNDKDNWSDNDGDGKADQTKDAFPWDKDNWTDADGDLRGDETDDAYPNDKDNFSDNDGDGKADQTKDAFPNDKLNWTDKDGDGKGDETKDAFPNDKKNWTDADGDGKGDQTKDAFPNDKKNWTDADGDGKGDETKDAFPNDKLNWTDSDGDGKGDETKDAYPDDKLNWSDNDGDGKADQTEDAFPSDKLNWTDSDGDGKGDETKDAYPNDKLNWSDTDKDGKADQTKDAFPNDGSEWLDTDGDGTGDNSDYDKNDPDIETLADWEQQLKTGPYDSVEDLRTALNYVKDNDGDHAGVISWGNSGFIDNSLSGLVINASNLAGPGRDVLTSHIVQEASKLTDDLYNKFLLSNTFAYYKKNHSAPVQEGKAGNSPFYKDNAPSFYDFLAADEFLGTEITERDRLFFESVVKKRLGNKSTLTQAFKYAKDNDVKLSDSSAKSIVDDLDDDQKDGLYGDYNPEVSDRDRDGAIDTADAFPNDSSETKDSDGDGVGNNADKFDGDKLNWSDADGDGKGDQTKDAFPNDKLNWSDNDGDGKADQTKDAFPNDKDNWTDADGDGKGDETKDAFPSDKLNWTDSDGDGKGDETKDAFPNNGSEWLDTDGDGTGDNSDYDKNDSTIKTEADYLNTIDSDNDGKPDWKDAFPNDKDNWTDSDGDGKGDETKDAFPNDGSEWLDTDKDGVGDNADYDDNNSSIQDRADYERILKDGPYEDVDKFLEAYNLVRKAGGQAIANWISTSPSMQAEWKGIAGNMSIGQLSDDADEDDVYAAYKNTAAAKYNLFLLTDTYAYHKNNFDAPTDADKGGKSPFYGADTKSIDGLLESGSFLHVPVDSADKLFFKRYLKEQLGGKNTLREAFKYAKDNDVKLSDEKATSALEMVNIVNGMREKIGLPPMGGLYGDFDPDISDVDRDGVTDDEDAFPNDASETVDSDNDGVGDNADEFPQNSLYSTQEGYEEWNATSPEGDADGDGYDNTIDVFPNDGSEWEDSDGDGVGDNLDFRKNNANIQTEEQYKKTDAYRNTIDTDGDDVPDYIDYDPDNAEVQTIWGADSATRTDPVVGDVDEETIQQNMERFLYKNADILYKYATVQEYQELSKEWADPDSQAIKDFHAWRMQKTRDLGGQLPSTDRIGEWLKDKGWKNVTYRPGGPVTTYTANGDLVLDYLAGENEFFTNVRVSDEAAQKDAIATWFTQNMPEDPAYNLMSGGVALAEGMYDVEGFDNLRTISNLDPDKKAEEKAEHYDFFIEYTDRVATLNGLYNKNKTMTKGKYDALVEDWTSGGIAPVANEIDKQLPYGKGFFEQEFKRRFGEAEWDVFSSQNQYLIDNPYQGVLQENGKYRVTFVGDSPEYEAIKQEYIDAPYYNEADQAVLDAYDAAVETTVQGYRDGSSYADMQRLINLGASKRLTDLWDELGGIDVATDQRFHYFMRDRKAAEIQAMKDKMSEPGSTLSTSERLALGEAIGRLEAQSLADYKNSYSSVGLEEFQRENWLKEIEEYNVNAYIELSQPLELPDGTFETNYDNRRLYMKMPGDEDVRFVNDFGSQVSYQSLNDQEVRSYFANVGEDSPFPHHYGNETGYFVDISGGESEVGEYTMVWVQVHEEPSSLEQFASRLGPVTDVIQLALSIFGGPAGRAAAMKIEVAQIGLKLAATGKLDPEDFASLVVYQLVKLGEINLPMSEEAAEAAAEASRAKFEAEAIARGYIRDTSSFADFVQKKIDAQTLIHVTGTGIAGLNASQSITLIKAAATGDFEDALIPILSGLGEGWIQNSLSAMGVSADKINAISSDQYDAIYSVVDKMAKGMDFGAAAAAVGFAELDDFLGLSDKTGAFFDDFASDMKNVMRVAKEFVDDPVFKEIGNFISETLVTQPLKDLLKIVSEDFDAGVKVITDAFEKLDLDLKVDFSPLETVGSVLDSSLSTLVAKSKIAYDALPDLVTNSVDEVVTAIEGIVGTAYTSLDDGLKEGIKMGLLMDVLDRDGTPQGDQAIRTAFLRELIAVKELKKIDSAVFKVVPEFVVAAGLRAGLNTVLAGNPNANEAMLTAMGAVATKSILRSIDAGTFSQDFKSYMDGVSGAYEEVIEARQKIDDLKPRADAATAEMNAAVAAKNQLVATHDNLRAAAEADDASDDDVQAWLEFSGENGTYEADLQAANDRIKAASDEIKNVEAEDQRLADVYAGKRDELALKDQLTDPALATYRNEISKDMVLDLAKDFNEPEYRLAMNLPADVNAYEHYLSTGINNGAPVNAEQYNARTDAALNNVVTRALTATGVDISTLSPEELRGLQAHFIESAKTFKPQDMTDLEYFEQQANLTDDQVKVNGNTAITEVFGSRDALDERISYRSTQNFFRNLYGEDMTEEEIRQRMNDVAMGTIRYTIDDEGNVAWGGDGFRVTEFNEDTGKFETYQYDAGGGLRYKLNDDGSEPFVKEYTPTPLYTDLNTLQAASPLAYSTFLREAVNVAPASAWLAEKTREMNQLIDMSVSEEEKIQIFKDYNDEVAAFQEEQDLREGFDGIPYSELPWIARVTKDALDYFQDGIDNAQEKIDELEAIDNRNEKQEENLVFYRQQLETAQNGLESFVNVTVRFPAGTANIFNEGVRAIGKFIETMPAQVEAERARRDIILAGGEVEDANAAADQILADAYKEIDFVSVKDNPFSRTANILESMAFGYLPEVYQEDVGEFWQTVEDAEGIGGKLEALYGELKDKPKVFLVEVIGMEIGQELATMVASLGAGKIATKAAGLAIADDVAKAVGVSTAATTNRGLEVTEAYGGAFTQAYDESYLALLDNGYTHEEAQAIAGEIAVGAGAISVLLMSTIPGAQALDKKVLSPAAKKALEELGERFVDGVGVIGKETLNEIVQEGGVTAYVEAALYNAGIEDRDYAGNIALNSTVAGLAAFGTTGTIYGLGMPTANIGGSDSSNPITNIVLTSPPIIDAMNSGDSAEVQLALGELGITQEVSNDLYIDVMNVADDSAYVSQSEARESFARLGVNDPSEADIDHAMALDSEAGIDNELTYYWQQTQGNIPNDTDGDGVYNDQDAFPNDASETTDSDNDGTGDNADVFPNDASETTDSDNDGVGDNADVFPNDASETADSDNDGVGDNADVFPNDASETVDSDSDGTGDNADVFPNDASETADSDNDGVGDNADAFPNDASETVDSDSDGTGDNADVFPNDASETVDSDNDGVGDNADVFPNDAEESADSDNDGVGDNADAFPNDATETLDTDNDGIGDNADDDDDNDDYPDMVDWWPTDPRYALDRDKDGIPNEIDDDIDGDGVPNEQDGAPNDPKETLDTDGDGIGNRLDWDDDGDGVADNIDAFPLDSTEVRDTDNDGIGDSSDSDLDGDGVENINDAFIYDPEEWADTDGDKVGDNEDTDDDNDGTLDVNDALPFNPDETLDTDQDGIGDNADDDDDDDGTLDANDAFPTDPTETTDTDSDGIGDTADPDDDDDGVLDDEDAFPLRADESVDTDGDGLGNNEDTDDDGDDVEDTEDAFPLREGESADFDNDGIGDNEDTDDDDDGVEDDVDVWPNDSSRHTDTDNDGVDDSLDAFPNDPAETTDSDNDGVGDEADWAPNDPSETVDTDGDGTGDNVDTDDDGDGFGDDVDAFPLNADEQQDADKDGLGDNEDPDDDNDGTLDDVDAFPNDPEETTDSDNDGVGDNADAFPENADETVDSDNDGVGDNTDAFPNDDSETTDSDNDGVGDNLDEYPEDAYYATTEDFEEANDMERLGKYALIADVNGDGTVDALTDGLLMLRYMFNMRGDRLIEDMITDGSVRNTAKEVEEYLSDPRLQKLFDVNSDGEVDALSDGLGLLRTLFGINNSDGSLTDDLMLRGDDPVEVIDNLAAVVYSAVALDENGLPTDDIKHLGAPAGTLHDTSYDAPELLDDEAIDALDTYTADELDTLTFSDSDKDGVIDADDAFPNNPEETVDSDNDGTGDNADAFPENADETLDTDNDGVGDNADVFPNDASETVDSDNDGVGDNADAFPENADETTDSDNDGVGDNADVFPNDASETVDSDNDGVGDNADAFPENADETVDSDNDGTGDNADVFPNDASETTDSDNDGVGDNADVFPNDASETVDSDNDGVGDNADAFPENADETVDSDNDGTGDNADVFPNDASETVDSDNDGVGDNADAFPNDASETVDSDSDGTGDNADVFPNDASETVDSDNDGTGDNADVFPNDASETTDSDNDGVGDNADVFPNDASETVDSDNDGVGDNADAFPENADETVDSDNDGTGDNADVFPNDASETTDSDNDGVGDNADVFPNDASETVDSDNDGVGDNADVFPNDASETVDSDNDGVGDNADVFPNDASETVDSDNDGTGDNADVFPNDASETTDSDNDGVGDNADVFPNDASETLDSDFDGVGDNADVFPNDAEESADSDNDGVGDNADVFPEDAAETTDSDNDGVGDNADVFPNDATETLDSDFDGVGDNADVFPNDAEESADSDNDGVGDNADVFPNDPEESADSDNDGVGDNADAFPDDASETLDTDNDGVGDNADAFPENADETVDSDNDGVGDNADVFPNDASETVDSDNDGVGDNADVFPNDASETVDSDSDGVGDNADVFPNDAEESADSDNDGTGDNADVFPNDASETTDSDNDGVGDNADVFPNDASETLDSDFDGVGDNADVFPNDAEESADSDNDGVGDNADVFPEDAAETTDSDNDGVGDNADVFPNDATETLDSDFDGVGDNADVFPNDAEESADSDNDGVGDNADVFPNDASETVDSDNDGVGDNADAFPENADETVDSDSDGVGDNADVFPNDAEESADSDSDGVGDNADAFPNDASETTDSDSDGIGDNADVFPNDPEESADSDNDGVGDNADAFPDDASETLDTDNDGVGDNADAFPENADETVDSDNDGVGDNADAFPNDASETADSDNDGVGDNADAFPEDASETVDSDSDGVGDNADVFPNDPEESADSDSDGMGDNADAFPNDATETVDSDFDGTGDNADTDDDNDGYADDEDDFQFNANEWLDSDKDGTGDNEDADDDNDGTLDDEDAFPLDASETVDSDNDGTGDNADVFPNDASETVDSDNDGVGDNADAFPNDDSETTDSDSDGVGDNADEFPQDSRFSSQEGYDDFRDTSIEDLEETYDQFKADQEEIFAGEIADLEAKQKTALDGKDAEIAGLQAQKEELQGRIDSLRQSALDAGETSEQRQKTIDGLLEQQNALNNTVTDLTKQRDDLLKEIEEYNTQIKELNTTAISTAAQITQLNEDIKALTATVEKLQGEALADGETLDDRNKQITDLLGNISDLETQKSNLVIANNEAIEAKDEVIGGLNQTISEQQDVIETTSEILGKEPNLVTEEDVALVTDYLAGVELTQEKLDNIGRYDVTGQDDLVTADDLELLKKALDGDYTGFDPDADFNPATGMYKTLEEKNAEIAALQQAEIDKQAEFDQQLEQAVTDAEIETEAEVLSELEIEAQNEVRKVAQEQAEKKKAQNLQNLFGPGRKVEVDTPNNPAIIQYEFDMFGDSIFATPGQEMAYTQRTPYSPEDATDNPYGQGVLSRVQDRLESQKQQSLSTGGKVKANTNEILRILGEK